MRHAAPVLLSLFVVVIGLAPLAAAQPVAAPTIHRVTLQPDTGVLTVTGTGLGPDLQVTVDGQPVPQLPGASDTQMQVLAPITVVTQPGTYRLTVVDVMRRVGDGFVVVSPAGRGPIAGEVSPARVPADQPPTAGEAAASRSVVGEADPTASRVVTAPSPMTVIEDSGPPYRTAIGYLALANNTTGSGNTASGYGALFANTTGGANTASGYEALRFNTTGNNNTASGVEALYSNTTGTQNTASGAFALRSNTTGAHNTASGWRALFYNSTGLSNTASGYRAGDLATTGSYNIFLGADVVGTAADTNTIRIGLPYNAGVGQNQTFIAGIRGTQLTGPTQLVYIDANGQLGTEIPTPPPGGHTSVTTPALADITGMAAALQAQQAAVAELRTENAELRARSQVQQATIDDLLARLARLEAAGRRRR